MWSAYVKFERIVSLMIVGEPESGKTELMKKYRNNQGVFVNRRPTAYGIIKDLLTGKMKMLFTSPKILGDIFVYDYATLYTFKSNTVDSTIEFFDALTEEGLSVESSYWINREELKPFEGLKGGLIAGINTFGFFTSSGKVKNNLYKGGCFSRNIVASISISETMRRKISDSISRGDYRPGKDYVSQIRLNFPKKRISVRISDEFAQQIRDIASETAEEYSNDLNPYKLQGFRLQKSLISIVKASALRDDRTEVIQRDVDRVRYLSQWMNLQMKSLKMEYPYA